MGDKTTQTSRWALCGRIIVYGSPAVTSILFVITFYQLALYQARLQQLEQSIGNERDSNGIQKNTEAIPQVLRAATKAWVYSTIALEK